MVSIRKATVNDVADIIKFQQAMALETENMTLDDSILEKGIKAMLDDPTKGTYYVAVMDNKVVGCFMITYEWSDWHNAMVWWLQSVYVKESQRKHGVFKTMYNWLIDRIKEDKSINGLRLYVDKTNVRAQKIYETMGMNGEHYTVFEWMK